MLSKAKHLILSTHNYLLSTFPNRYARWNVILSLCDQTSSQPINLCENIVPYKLVFDLTPGAMPTQLLSRALPAWAWNQKMYRTPLIHLSCIIFTCFPYIQLTSYLFYLALWVLSGLAYGQCPQNDIFVLVSDLSVLLERVS